MMAYGYDGGQSWETPQQAAQRRFYERQQEEERRQQLMIQMASLGLNFQGDNFNNQFRLENMTGDILQQQIANQRQTQGANMNTAQMGRDRLERGNRETTNPYTRSAKTLYNY